MVEQSDLTLNLERAPFAVAAFDWELHGSRGEGLDDIVDLAGDLNFGGFAAVKEMKLALGFIRDFLIHAQDLAFEFGFERCLCFRSVGHS